MNDLIFIIIIFAIILLGFIKKLDLVNIFIDQTKQSLILSSKIFPFVYTFSISLVLIKYSGIIEYLEKIIKINTYNIIQVILRPMSSQSSLLLVLNVYDKCGVDSVFSNFATLIHSAIDAFIYMICLYQANVEINNKIFFDSIILYVITIVIVVIILLLL